MRLLFVFSNVFGFAFFSTIVICFTSNLSFFVRPSRVMEARIADEFKFLIASLAQPAASAADVKARGQALLLRLDAATQAAVEKEWPSSSSGGSVPTTGAQASAALVSQRAVWKIVIRFCRRYSLSLSTTYLESCGRAGAWLPFLLFAQEEQFPEDRVRMENYERC